jgi:hypothetical protein
MRAQVSGQVFQGSSSRNRCRRGVAAALVLDSAILETAVPNHDAVRDAN